jgi:superfamily I DNA/RNA helicase
VSTIHKIKGGEADNVVVFLDCTRKVFRNKFLDLDSELRLLYVAFTRARKNLYIIRSRSTYGLDDIVNNIYDYARSTYDA